MDLLLDLTSLSTKRKKGRDPAARRDNILLFVVVNDQTTRSSTLNGQPTHPTPGFSIALCAPPSPFTLRNRDAVFVGRENSVGSDERLRSRTDALHDLVRRHAVILDEVVDKVHQVTAVVLDVGLRDEAVHRHLGVAARVQAPRHTANRRRADGATRLADGARAAQRAQPDHELVVGSPVGRGAGEDVVCDVGDEVRAGVAMDGRYVLAGTLECRDVFGRKIFHAQGVTGQKDRVVRVAHPLTVFLRSRRRDVPPLPRRWHGRNLAQRSGLHVQDGVGVRLDAVLVADPGPLGRPLQAVAADAYERRALLARLGVVHAPEVIVQDVVARLDVVPLAAELHCLSFGQRGSQCRERQSREDSADVLHLCGDSVVSERGDGVDVEAQIWRVDGLWGLS